MCALDIVEVFTVKFRIDEILKEKGKSRYWLYIQLGLSYQNFKKIVENQTTSIKFENLKAICDILECTPNDLFVEYHGK
jgi:putative transcriptional regulator